jgi:hypothetical protein
MSPLVSRHTANEVLPNLLLQGGNGLSGTTSLAHVEPGDLALGKSSLAGTCSHHVLHTSLSGVLPATQQT